MESYNANKALLDLIKKKGGYCNVHSHLDRSNTVTKNDFEKVVYSQLQEKWKLVDSFKRSASVERYYENISSSLKKQKQMGTTSILSFIDLDEVCEERALEAALICKEEFNNSSFSLSIACQTLKGVVDPSARKLLEKNIEKFDLIGSLPAADNDLGKHLDIILDWGRNLNKRVHVHVDQLNISSEKETALLIKKTKQHRMEGMVTAVHSISLACQNKLYREGVYKAAKDVELSFITCPTAWIDSRRTEAYTVTHNAITPVDEMIKYGLKIGIGSDNIYDIYKPFSDGNMTTELKFLLEATHIYDIELLSDIATKNGREIIGL